MDGATTFPVSMARGATFDPELEERVGDVIGREIRALGGNYFGGVCINLLRHPAWGRAQESYGEDSFHLGMMGAALATGVQNHVMACVKHFALNSMENARQDVDVTADARTLHEVYLAHFKRVVDAGVASVMTVLQQRQRRMGRPEPRADHRHPEGHVGLHRLHRHRLHHRHARRQEGGARRPGCRDALRHDLRHST